MEQQGLEILSGQKLNRYTHKPDKHTYKWDMRTRKTDRRKALSLLFVMCMLPLAACTPGNLGSNVIAFLRAGNLWTIDPNGANAFEVEKLDTAIVGYSWSPSHQIFAFRALYQDFAKTATAKHLSAQPITGQVGDVPGSENTIGVDGGEPIPIAFSSTDIGYSNTFWNTNSTRLLYRQSAVTASTEGVNPLATNWFVSQSDQPGGIALKELPRTFSIPSVSYDSSNYLTIEHSPKGIFTTTLAGTQKHILVSGAVPGHPLPATLERILWQPQHQNQSFVYAITDPLAATQEQELILRTTDGHITPLTTCTCTQFAWSPDGNYLLYTTGTDYTLLNITSKATFHVAGENGSVPYWSPDGQFLILEGQHTLQDSSLVGSDTLLQPVPNNIWSAERRHFLFLTGQRLFWQGQKLSQGKGMYTVSIDDQGHPQGFPTLVDTGNDSQAGWTYQDANTSFLF